MNIQNNPNVNPKLSQEIRDSYDNSLIPNRFSTWLTGKAHSTKTTNTVFNWCTYTLFTILGLFGGLYGVLVSYNYYVQGVCALLIVAMSRRLAAVVIHQAVHNRLSGNELFDMLIGEFCSIITLSQDYHSYKKDHCKTHHAPDSFATERDPILIFLTKSGVKPGLTAQELRLSFWLCLVSPLFHIKFILKRLAYNINSTKPIRTAISLSYYCLVGWLIIEQQNYSAFIFIFLALVILYQISAFIEIISEHLWYGNLENRKNTPYFYADISWGRFCGLQYPVKRNNLFMWYVCNLAYHLPVRLFILVGDLPQHDFHHRHPIVVNWVNAAQLRNDAILKIQEEEPPYLEVWGIHNAIGIVFDQLALSPVVTNQIENNID